MIKDILSTVYKTKSSKKNNVSSGDEKKRPTKKDKLDNDGNVKTKKKHSTYNLYIKAGVKNIQIYICEEIINIFKKMINCIF